MHFILPFFVGIGASILGTLLPGILNATVVKISKEKGMKHVYSFMAGTFVIIALQTYLAVFFAKIIDKSVFITNILREIGLVVFVLLTIYFFSAKSNKNLSNNVAVTQKRRSFSQGVVLALINILPVFYYVFITVTVLNRNLYEVYYLSNILLTIGVLVGTFLTFMFYLNLFKTAVVEESFVLQNINKILGCITAIIVIFNLYKLFV